MRHSVQGMNNLSVIGYSSTPTTNIYSLQAFVIRGHKGWLYSCSFEVIYIRMATHWPASRPEHSLEHSGSRSELFSPVGSQVISIDHLSNETGGENENELKLVEEIESLCMNCEENVCISL